MITQILSKVLKNKFTLFTLLTLIISTLVFGLQGNLNKNNTIQVEAAPVCPSGFTWNGTTCQSNSPTSYDCSAIGGVVSGTNCVSFSCPQGGDLSGTNCVASNTNPVQTAEGCPLFAPGVPLELVTPFGNFCYDTIPTGTNSGFYEITNSCNLGFDPIALLNYVSIGFISLGTPVTYEGSSLFVQNFVRRSPDGTCSAIISFPISQDPNDPQLTISDSISGYRKKGFYISNFSYPATTTTLGPATPIFSFSNPTSYIPEIGQITNLVCTPSTVNSGGVVSCSGQATGAPSGVPYSGSVTVTIGSGGGTGTTNFNPDGSFTVTNISVGTNSGSSSVVKTATTDLGGSTNITVNPSNVNLTPLDISSGRIAFSCGTNNFVSLNSTPTNTNNTVVNGSITNNTIYNTRFNYLSSSVPTTTCNGVLPPNTQLDTNNSLTLKIGNIGIGNLTSANRLESDTCTISSGQTQGSGIGGSTPITCLNVPVGSLTGSNIIFAKLGVDGVNNTAGTNYGVFLDSLKKTNVYSSEVFSDGVFSFLKGTTGATNAYNNILHKDWRTGVSGNEARIQLSNLKTYRDIFPGTSTSSQTNTQDTNGNTVLTNPSYICNISVRPAGSTGSFTNLVNDLNNNGTIESTEISSTTANDIPYNTTNNNCSALFTNSLFTGGQTNITASQAKTYNWEVKIEIKDLSLATTPGNSATAPIVSTFNNNVGFKFAAIIPGGRDFDNVFIRG